MTLKIPAHLQPYIDVLGEDLAVRFFLAFGGAPIYLAGRPQEATDIMQLIGREKIAELSARLDTDLIKRVPINREWIARRLKAEGISVLEIARRLHVSDVTVRKLLKDKEQRQLSFFAQL